MEKMESLRLRSNALGGSNLCHFTQSFKIQESKEGNVFPDNTSFALLLEVQVVASVQYLVTTYKQARAKSPLKESAGSKTFVALKP